MIVDLESWEAGYDDGLLGRPSQCTPGLDRFSYSSGYVQARACRPGTQEDLRLRYTGSSLAQKRDEPARLIIAPPKTQLRNEAPLGGNERHFGRNASV